LSYLLDTNVLCETTQLRPSRRVEAWLKDKPQDVIHVSVLSIGEVRRGIERLPVVETLIAAAAITDRLRVVTRKVQDFSFRDLEVINPWNP
jgi:predicted nucleic acid-binding protein